MYFKRRYFQVQKYSQKVEYVCMCSPYVQGYSYINQVQGYTAVQRRRKENHQIINTKQRLQHLLYVGYKETQNKQPENKKFPLHPLHLLVQEPPGGAT